MMAITHRLGILLATLPLINTFMLTRQPVVVVEPSHPIFSAKNENAIQTNVEELSQITVVALKDRLRQLNLPLGGKKVDLVKRLLDYADQQIQPDTFEPNQEDAASPSEKNEYDDNTIHNLTVPALKERLRELGLSVGGRKCDLIERLLAYENAHTVDDDLLHLDLSNDDEDNANDAAKSESSTRRAKRKKFWKTQEVRELIKTNDKRAIGRAEEMITQLERMAAEEGDDEYLPGPIQYTTLIEAYSRGGTIDAPQRAEKVINRLLSANTNKSGTTPTTPMLNASEYLSTKRMLHCCGH